jgi:hypothetical protein
VTSAAATAIAINSSVEIIGEIALIERRNLVIFLTFHFLLSFFLSKKFVDLL